MNDGELTLLSGRNAAIAVHAPTNRPRLTDFEHTQTNSTGLLRAMSGIVESMRESDRIPISAPQIAEFCHRWQIQELALFGSVLGEQFGDESDVDVLITFAAGVPYTFRHLTAMQSELEAIFGRSVDLVDRTAVEQSENYIRRNSILKSAELIYA